MPSRVRSILTLIASIALGVILLLLALRGVDLDAVVNALASAEWIWIIPLLFITTLSHVIRAQRWVLLLDTLPRDGDQPTATTPNKSKGVIGFGLAFSSMLIGYLINYLAPRLGEFARAGYLASRSRLRFPGIFGTVVAERVLDVLALVVCFAVVVLIYGARLDDLLAGFGESINLLLQGLPVSPTLSLVLATVLAIGLLGWGWIAIRRGHVLGGLLKSFRDGFASVVRTRRVGALLTQTILMWVCYALMAYFPLLILSIEGLSVIDAFALMTLGAIGMALPTPGGIGSYHFFVVQTFVLLFAVAAAPAATYALLTHAAQALFFAIAGAIAIMWQGTTFASIRGAAKEARQASGD